MTTPTTPRWRAPRADGLAHAYLPRRPAALCGAPNQDERFDHPTRRRHDECARLAAERAGHLL